MALLKVLVVLQKTRKTLIVVFHELKQIVYRNLNELLQRVKRKKRDLKAKLSSLTRKARK
ncbi:MAG: hypothetical protein CME98_21885 [Hyphomonas sp.]|nr:hypothetical protein [Hyphomonas sp.]